jgi:hypothetical protein
VPKRLNPEIPVKRLQELYSYDLQLGEIRNRVNNRRILPDPDNGSVVCYDSLTGLRKKMLYRNLAYALGGGKFIPTQHKILPLDLDDKNIKFNNLKLVSQGIYWDIKIALRNLLGELKITQHPTDKNAHVVQWVTRKQHRTVVTYDIGNAEALKHEKALEFSKVVNQHIRSD